MASTKEPLASRVETSYRKLSSVASDLNFTSDELGKLVCGLDSALKKLNLGVSAWVMVEGEDHPDEGWFRREDVGYDKIGGTWGIALRKMSGTYGDFDREDWLFNDGPRSLRLAAIEMIPQLLEQLSTEAEETARKIRGRLEEVKEVVAVVTKAAEEPVKRVVARGPLAQEQNK